MSRAGLNWIEHVPEAGCLKENMTKNKLKVAPFKTRRT